jgi:hypothetical protein
MKKYINSVKRFQLLTIHDSVKDILVHRRLRRMALFVDS